MDYEPNQPEDLCEGEVVPDGPTDAFYEYVVWEEAERRERESRVAAREACCLDWLSAAADEDEVYDPWDNPE